VHSFSTTTRNKLRERGRERKTKSALAVSPSFFFLVRLLHIYFIGCGHVPKRRLRKSAGTNETETDVLRTHQQPREKKKGQTQKQKKASERERRQTKKYAPANQHRKKKVKLVHSANDTSQRALSRSSHAALSGNEDVRPWSSKESPSPSSFSFRYTLFAGIRSGPFCVFCTP
jgi:hypothetical protein